MMPATVNLTECLWILNGPYATYKLSGKELGRVDPAGTLDAVPGTVRSHQDCAREEEDMR